MIHQKILVDLNMGSPDDREWNKSDPMYSAMVKELAGSVVAKQDRTGMNEVKTNIKNIRFLNIFLFAFSKHKVNKWSFFRTTPNLGVHYQRVDKVKDQRPLNTTMFLQVS